jgi:hypothetical protein
MQETKHEKFLRLMKARLERALEDFRLISQLASTNYRNTPEEAYEAITILDRALKATAASFGIGYRSWVQDPRKAKDFAPQLGEINEIDAAKSIAFIESGNPQFAIEQLKAAINKEPR